MSYKSGTLGGLLAIKKETSWKKIGITAGHLHVGESIFRVVSNEIDCAFFSIPDCSTDDVNLLYLEFPGDDFEPVVGEVVYKIGKSTGYTTGKLSSMSSEYVVGIGKNRLTYTDHVEVSWDVVESATRFACSDDCGALYCVKRNSKFVPIAIH